MKEFLPILTGLITFLVTAVGTYFATRSKVKLDLMVEYDKSLRAERLAAYKLLWKELKPLARYSAEKPLTYEIINETSGKMRDWYFDNGGGIYLSKQSRTPYFNLKKSMQKIIKDKSLDDQQDLIKEMLYFGMILRDSLSDDIGTRRESFFNFSK